MCTNVRFELITGVRCTLFMNVVRWPVELPG